MRKKIDQRARARRGLRVLLRTLDPMTYGALGKRLGLHHRAVRYFLRVIQDEMLRQGRPAITGLVINAESGMPGVGFYGAKSGPAYARLIKRIKAYNWPRNKDLI